MKRIEATKFKEQCLKLLDTLGPDGLVITKHGKPVAKVVPVGPENAALIGSLRGKIKVKGNIISTDERWDADAES